MEHIAQSRFRALAERVKRPEIWKPWEHDDQPNPLVGIYVREDTAVVKDQQVAIKVIRDPEGHEWGLWRWDANSVFGKAWDEKTPPIGCLIAVSVERARTSGNGHDYRPYIIEWEPPAADMVGQSGHHPNSSVAQGTQDGNVSPTGDDGSAEFVRVSSPNHPVPDDDGIPY